MGCSTAHWSDRHPLFPVGSALAETTMPDLGERWILVRGAWFAEQLKLSPAQVYDTLGEDVREIFAESVIQNLPTVRAIASTTIDSFAPTEAQKLDDHIFIKGRFPAQGQTLLTNGLAVSQLLLIHELTIGPDLSRENIYDYDKANQDTEGNHHKVKKLTAIATWTLWDNHKGHFLVSGISEVVVPYQGETGPELRKIIHDLIPALTAKIHCGIIGACP